MYYYIKYASPLGELTVLAESGAITALVIEGQKYAELHLEPVLEGNAAEREIKILQRAREWLDAYFAGENPDPSRLKLNPEGTEFQMRVWEMLEDIPYGYTVSYRDLAMLLHSSPRAVGGAVGRNPISIIIPCHRVVGARGRVTGYAGGIENKRKLLELEDAVSNGENVHDWRDFT